MNITVIHDIRDPERRCRICRRTPAEIAHEPERPCTFLRPAEQVIVRLGRRPSVVQPPAVRLGGAR